VASKTRKLKTEITQLILQVQLKNQEITKLKHQILLSQSNRATNKAQKSHN